MVYPRIAIAGIAIEAATFGPHRSGDDDFRTLRGDDLWARYPFLHDGQDYRAAADWVPLLRATALPGGTVRRDTYERLAGEVVAGLWAAGPVDAVWLDLHGAMTVEGLADAEADLVSRVRAVVGPGPFVAASFDLHGNVSRRLEAQLDHLTCYRMAPHEDEDNTRMRLCRTLLGRLRGPGGADPSSRRLVKAFVDVPILLPGEKTSTRFEPARSLYGELPAIEALPGVEDASIWIGYAWADEPRCHAVVGVVGDDIDTCRSAAEELAGRVWAARHDFGFGGEAGRLDACLDAALARHGALDGPFVISDSGDNPTAGGAGDVTWTLARILEHPLSTTQGVSVVYASLPDAAAVAMCVRAGVGHRVEVRAGALVDSTHEGPLLLEGTVEHLGEDPVGGTCALLRIGPVRVILTSRRKPFHTRADFAPVGIVLEDCDVLVVKIGYLEPELHEVAKAWMLALTPGAVDQDLERLPYRHRMRPLFPFESEMDSPDLTARVSRGGETC